MEKDDKAMKPLKPAERFFVKEIISNGLEPIESYCKVNNIILTDDNLKSIKGKVNRLLAKENVKNYYEALMEEVRDREIQKSVWTKEVATDKLMRLIEKAETDIYEENKPITMARLSAILQPAKELNLINGFNQTNINIESNQLVQFVGEDDIPE